ncbi:MAG: hypothetical protein IT379_14675 [Deltaproteobacteria bacterium]|nr:hypothetical protein [Deltaproteobacteria bacterium]
MAGVCREATDLGILPAGVVARGGVGEELTQRLASDGHDRDTGLRRHDGEDPEQGRCEPMPWLRADDRGGPRLDEQAHEGEADRGRTGLRDLAETADLPRVRSGIAEALLGGDEREHTGIAAGGVGLKHAGGVK